MKTGALCFYLDFRQSPGRAAHELEACIIREVPFYLRPVDNFTGNP